MNGFAMIGNLVAVAWNGINILETVYLLGQKLQVWCMTETLRTLHSQFLQSIDSARVQQLAHNAIRLFQALL